MGSRCQVIALGDAGKWGQDVPRNTRVYMSSL